VWGKITHWTISIIIIGCQGLNTGLLHCPIIVSFTVWHYVDTLSIIVITTHFNGNNNWGFLRRVWSVIITIYPFTGHFVSIIIPIIQYWLAAFNNNTNISLQYSRSLRSIIMGINTDRSFHIIIIIIITLASIGNVQWSVQ